MLKLSGRLRHVQDVLAAVGLGGACYASALIGVELATAPPLGTPVWLATGLGMAAVYLYGYRLWPGMFLGLVAALAQALDHTSLGIYSTYLLVVGPSAIYTAEAVCGVWLVRRLLGKQSLLDSPTNVFRFAAVAVLVTAASSSLITLTSLGGADAVATPHLSLWLTQWLGNLAGVMLIVPTLVAAVTPSALRWTRASVLEAGAAFLLTFIAAQILFGNWLAELVPPANPLPIILFLLWIAIRFSTREVALALLVVATLALVSTFGGAGPYPSATLTDALLRTLSFLIVTAAGFFTLGAALLQNRRSTAALRNINATLEQRVRQRTDALAHVNKELQQYRDRLEELVAERTADLELANREIESFSYSVSHDLRSPLRAIDGYSHALLEDYGEVLDDKARQYLERSRAASQRMGDLIDDVLLLSRVTRHELELHQVDLTTLAHEVIEEIKAATPGREVAFEVAADLTVQGDEHLMRIVLENLLGNAWKYTAKQAQPRVELGARHGNGEYVFYVRDNGVGFDMHYASQLFGAFQRLHDPEEFEGTGIGLATVARVMTRHGGRVWAEGQVNKGATFYFAFPERGRTTGPRKAIQLTDLN